MCTANNASNLPSWNIHKQRSSDLPSVNANSTQEALNYRMLFANESNKQTDKNSIMQSKYFISPLRPFPLTPEECNEILIKRASLTVDGVQSNPSIERSVPKREYQVHSNDNSQTSLNFSNIKLRPYSCTECGKTFIQKHHLTTHKKVHSGIRPHACTHCGKAFTHKHCLNTHLLLHSSDRPYQCNVCKKSFTLKHHLISHAKVHSREKPFVCTDCGRAFPLKRHLVTHTKFHAGERPFVCEECGESFVSKEHLVMHSRFHGSTNSFACHDCGAAFTRKFELVNHSRLHGHIPLSCPVCNKEFMQKRTLVVHMRIHTVESSFYCLTCGEGFHLRNELSLHMKSHESSQPNSPDKSLLCSDCGSSFNNPEALALHVKLHSGDASFVNDLCTLTANLPGASFPFHHNFKTKENAKSDGSAAKAKSHVCKFCSKVFSAKHGLQQHNKRHPEGTCALKSHVCDVCSKAFYQKNHMLLHQRQHMDPSLRNPNYSKLQSELESNNSESNRNFFQQGQLAAATSLDIGTAAADVTTDNGDVTSLDKKGYLLPYDNYSGTKQPQTEGECKLEPSIEGESDMFVKSNFFQANYGLESLRNVDIKMQMTDVRQVKSDNHNFAIVRQTVV